ncbi:semaphorin-4B isoform X3 [Molossus molossus]|uniref:semaphorin-4B isoform X3 n=1 Tax=Molossus molossus TaxID=27622 RepID=UPI001745D3CC|nr:semaphorin-4B isoform X3 [Molossus molossus]
MAGGTRPPSPLLLLLLLLPPPAIWGLVPRISLPLGSEERPFLRFQTENVSNYTALLLSRDGKTLYVGAREALFALNSSTSFLPGGRYQELLWSADAERKYQCSFKGKDPQRDCQNYIKILLPLNSSHLFTCGTGAFSPLCTYINVENFTLARDQAGKVLLEDGKGRCPFDPNFKSTALMVDGELYTGTVSNFLGNDPAISRSQSRRPTKTESSLNWLQARPARSLSSSRTLSCPALPASARHRGTTEGSAICVFTMKDVQRAFNGLYKEVNRETQQWYTVTYEVPTPRPGACITNSTRERKISSSLQLPDRVLNFLKDHFLMDGQVRSHLLLLQPQARYQRVAVHRVRGLHHTYDVLFLGTGDGRLHKAVSVGPRVHIIEELQIFSPGQPVQNLLLDPDRGLLYAASHSGVVQVPVANCSLYQSCGDCLLARDPYCAWSSSKCRHISLYHHGATSRSWIQDIEGANTRDLCNTSMVKPRVAVPAGEKPCEQVQFQPNSVNTLTCPLLSNLATRLWLHNGVPVNGSASCRVLSTGDLLLAGSQQELGVFQCWSLEEDFRQLVASYCPKVEDTVTERRGKGSVIINTSRVSAPAHGKASWSVDKSYWTEFLVMSVLFVFVIVLLLLFFLYRHRDGMKVFLKQGECASVHPKTRPVVLPPETRPLNGVGPPSTPLDHRGYQALSDNSPGTQVFTESEKRPLSIHDSFVEVSPVCPRPRVRLGSEIRDSVV